MKKDFKEDPKIENEDWRLQAVTTLAKDWKSPWTGILHQAGERVGVIASIKYKTDKKLSFDLPNMEALFLDFSYRLWDESENIIKENNFIKEIKKDDFFVLDNDEFLNMLEMKMGSIVFAYTALESFANDLIPKEYTYKTERNDKKCSEIYDKSQIERNINLETKLDIILPEILNIKTIKSDNLWSKFKELKKLRDRIIHMKSVDKRSSMPEDNTIWKELLNVQNSNPAIIAKNIIDFHVSNSSNKPRWINKVPF